MAITEGATVTEMPDRESLAAKVARIDETVQNVEQAVAELKTAQMGAVDMTDKRLRMLEDVRVRALEDARLAEKVREDERAKLAAAQAAATAQASAQALTKRQFWIGIAVTTVVGILAALLEAHII